MIKKFIVNCTTLKYNSNELTHYFHQVQLRLYVGADLYGWCDFCVYTCKGMSIEQIYIP